MLAIASQIILCLVLAALLGLIIGYLLGKSNCPKATYKTGAVTDPHTHDDGDCGDGDDDDTANNAAKTSDDEALTENSPGDDAAQAQGLMSSEDGAVTEGAQADETQRDAAIDEGGGAPSDDDKPSGLLDAPRNDQKDNLTRIKGIGVKIDTTLNGIGVYHFDQIAAWTEKEATWIDHYLSFPGRALRDDWIGQAKLLAEGKETEFSKRVDAGDVSTSKKS